jgi:hypothetical protein
VPPMTAACLRYSPCCVTQRDPKFIEVPHLRICIDTLRTIDGCNGEPSHFLCYDLHIDGKIIHCYPVSEAEANRIMGDAEVEICDGLNC